ncbi:T9SS type A sorting domain-containing protein [Coprobacter secundus]|uniref:Secretion system C-terminal sorting domain-containing protein n=1 Tax=Coprobacter secundus subsp. similis TaxID=2751153 RepID=A0A7G1HU49_9BACT|nr:T9SS type A sorting domain-containing protein [Coprobacter secundus]BCI62061.1 hypothetical protein Cop2CBH44_04140 [Coprobacter secundus subsp. similis]
MKKKTLLSVVLAVLMAVPVSAEIRIYFAYGKNRNIDLPGEADYQFDVRKDEKVVNGWMDGGSGPGDVNEYTNYWPNGNGQAFKYTFNVMEGAGTLDLSGVTADWVLHMDTRFWQHNCDLNITFYDNEGKEFTYMVPKDTYVLDDWGWNPIDVNMSDFVDLGLDFSKAIYTNQIFFSFGSAAPIEVGPTEIAYNDIYLTDYETVENPEEFEIWKGGETGVASVKKEQKIALAMSSDVIKVVNNPGTGFAIYNICGNMILESSENVASIENLAAGVYIVKAGNQSIKFVKK